MNLTTCYCDLTNSLKPYLSAIDYYNRFIILSTNNNQVLLKNDFEDDFENDGVHAWIEETEHSLLNIFINYIVNVLWLFQVYFVTGRRYNLLITFLYGKKKAISFKKVHILQSSVKRVKTYLFKTLR